MDKQIVSGEPVYIKLNAITLEGCCDCSLIHAVVYRIRRIKGKQVLEKICYRDDWETNIVRNSKT